MYDIVYSLALASICTSVSNCKRKSRRSTRRPKCDVTNKTNKRTIIHRRQPAHNCFIYNNIKFYFINSRRQQDVGVVFY